MEKARAVQVLWRKNRSAQKDGSMGAYIKGQTLKLYLRKPLLVVNVFFCDVLYMPRTSSACPRLVLIR